VLLMLAGENHSLTALLNSGNRPYYGHNQRWII
jgi:hypothetical protein